MDNNLCSLLDELPLNTRRDMWFQHDGALAHSAINVREWLNSHFNGRWIGCGGVIAWPPRSPDMNPLDFFYGLI